ncbi:MAG: GDSL-type esterase/lipase family protein [Acidobacteriota bacterium]|nr:GDSL-type esterase/lipase family protein [Acidobacteriota bacterium]
MPTIPRSHLRRFWLVIGTLALAPGLMAEAGQSPDPRRFEKDIAAFEAEDRAAPPPAGSTLFVGSSSIRYWDVAKAFPTRSTIKRGFGGSHVSDNVYYADRIIVRYKPALIVFYAGDADVAAGKTAEQIAADVKTLIALIHERLPGTTMVIIGTKPSPAHWAHIDTIRRANRLVKALVANDPLAAYADVDDALVGSDGHPRPDFYAENGLNLNERGYEAWTAAVRPVIDRLGPGTIGPDLTQLLPAMQ